MRIGLAVTAALALDAAAAPVAHAVSVRTAVDRLIIRADPGETNRLTLAGGYVVSDPGAGSVTTAGHCDVTGPREATCAATGITSVFATMDDGADTVTNSTGLPGTLSGGEGSDTVTGGPAGETIRGGPQADILHGGGGNDTIDSRGDVPDEVNCGPGEDTAIADLFDRIVTDPANPDACEHVDRGVPAPGPGQPPIPPAVVAGAPPFITASAPGTPIPASAAVLGAAVPRGRCTTPFIGTAGDDRIDGSDADDRIFGMNGADVLNGLKGDDCVFGVAGADQAFGATGDDLVAGGAGADRLDGGEGDDRLVGNGGNDRAVGGRGRDRVSGGAGNDVLSGGTGRDRLVGDAGDDRLTSGAGNDTLSGGAGRDRLSAGAGADVLRGGAGANTLLAGLGNDTVDVRNGRRDTVDCGAGRDSARADSVDRLRRCERVTRARRR
jgi:Ca2+-binding RTX toxin-like protein